MVKMVDQIMPRLAAAITLFLALVLPGEPVCAGECRKFMVTAADGYANVRSHPQVKSNNVVAALPSGTGIEIIKKGKHWYRINAPVEGWIAGTQISRFSCRSGSGVSTTLGEAAVARLGKQAASGDRRAAEIFIKMARGVDGSFAEGYAEAITLWAGHDPSSLLSVLDKQPPSVLKAVLALLDFGFGVGPSAPREQFEAALGRLPADTPVIQEWHRIVQDGR